MTRPYPKIAPSYSSSLPVWRNRTAFLSAILAIQIIHPLLISDASNFQLARQQSDWATGTTGLAVKPLHSYLSTPQVLRTFNLLDNRVSSLGPVGSGIRSSKLSSILILSSLSLVRVCPTDCKMRLFGSCSLALRRGALAAHHRMKVKGEFGLFRSVGITI